MIAAGFRAMGTTVAVTAADDAGIETTRLLFAQIEDRLSRFRPESELSRVNDAVAPVRVSAMLADVLALAAELRSRTGGLVDVGVGRDVDRWGYDRTFEDVPEQMASAPGEGTPGGWRLEGRTLVRSPGTSIDLGGIAKGWACDVAVDRGLADLVAAGGDVRSAHPEAAVEVADRHGDVVATVGLGRRALATSSIAHRRWVVGGEEAHHIIDPRTGRPAVTPVVSATVVAATATEAEAGAKAVLILGADGLAWASRQPWIEGALVVWEDGAVYATPDLELAA